MAWAEITKNHDWPVPGKRAVIAFRAGTRVSVTRDQLASIKAAGAGREIKRPSRPKPAKVQPVVAEPEAVFLTDDQGPDVG